jgi:predicted Zn-dependent peptidase
MVFKGTKRYRTGQIAESLESLGGYLNAFTSKEHTCFYARVLDEHLPKAVDVLSDLVQFPSFKPIEIEKEKQVVAEEIKNLDDSPDDQIHDVFDSAIFQHDPLAYPVIGTATNVASFQRVDLMRHHERFFKPNRMVVAVAGNLRHDAVVDLVARFFRTRGSRNGAGRRSRSVRKYSPRNEVIERPITQSHVCMGAPGIGVTHRDRYPLLVLNTLLGEGMSSRLFQNIREKYGFAYTIYSFVNFLRDAGNVGVYVATDREHVDRSISLIRKELGRLVSTPVGGAELRRTKSQLKGTMMLGLESMSNRMMRLGSSELYFGQNVAVDAILRNIDNVSAESIQSVAVKLLRDERYSTVIFSPLKKSVPVAR